MACCGVGDCRSDERSFLLRGLPSAPNTLGSTNLESITADRAVRPGSHCLSRRGLGLGFSLEQLGQIGIHVVEDSPRTVVEDPADQEVGQIAHMLWVLH